MSHCTSRTHYPGFHQYNLVASSPLVPGSYCANNFIAATLMISLLLDCGLLLCLFLYNLVFDRKIYKVVNVGKYTSANLKTLLQL